MTATSSGPHPGPDRDQARLTLDEATGQSLARGAVGIALLHIERARSGTGDWRTAQAHLRRVTAGPVDVAEHVGLFYGAPAVAFVLHAAADRYPRLRATCQALDEHVLRLTRRRLARAWARIECGEPAAFAEYDLFYGLTGIGALLLRHRPDSDELAGILRYAVTLSTRPHRDGGTELPGWWVAHDPDEILPTPGGHANFGMAHGAAGLLAFLALATRHGRVVADQHEAIGALTGWFDRWQQDGPDGPWWPQWITRDELRDGRPACGHAPRASWCYGTVGIARARQLAALATNDQHAQHAAEDVLAASLTGTQLDRIADPGLCHGVAGVYQTVYRAAHDVDAGSVLAARLPALATRLARSSGVDHDGHDDAAADSTGLLTGLVGVELARETARHDRPPHTGWDSCLLIT